jgi:WhiB family redox-sensing transcriptional regulator
MLPPRPEWQSRAACAGKPTVWFFCPSGVDGHERSRWFARGRLVCADCPVRVECLNYALSNGERHGLWGGASPRQRIDMRMGRAS